MGKRSSKRRQQKKKPAIGDGGKRSKRYSPVEIFMAVLGALLVIMFGVLGILVVFG